MTANDPLDKLLHDVNSKCANLKNAAGLLRDSPAAERDELLALMRQETRDLLTSLEGFATRP